MGYASVIWLLVAGCSFTAPSAGGSDGSPTHDAGRDAHPGPDGPIDAMPDALGPPRAHFVQSMHAATAITTSHTLEVSETEGDLMIVAAYSTNPAATFAVTDTAGLTWTPEAAVAPTGCMPALQLWHAPVGASAIDAVTATADVDAYMGTTVTEYSGVSAVSSAATVAAPASSTIATMTMTTTEQAMVFVVFADSNGAANPAPASGWNERENDGFFYSVAQDNGVGATAGTQSPSASPLAVDDNCWVGAAVALRTP